MTIIGHGVDVIACHRVQEVIDRHGQRLLDRLFTKPEQAYCRKHRHPSERFAGRFAAKEAVLKVLGTGWRNGIAWTDVEIINDPLGRPEVTLGGHVAQTAGRMGIAQVLLSISHTHEYAVASAIGVSE